jgi:hypothetical protein
MASSRRWLRSVCSIGILGVVTACLAADANAQGQLKSQGREEESLAQRRMQAANPAITANPSVKEGYGKLPLSFERNGGQTDARVKYMARGNGYSLFLTSTEAVLALKGSPCQDSAIAPNSQLRRLKSASSCTTRQAAVRLQLLGANPSAQISGMDPLPGKSNYFIGNDPSKWRTDVPNYARVKYENVYPGVDVVYYGNQGQLEFDLVVAPGADLGRLRFHLAGAKKLKLNSDGDLIIGVSDGELSLHKPVIYQSTPEGKKPIEGRYVLAANHEVAFEAGPYDKDKPLVVDPVLEYSTFVGGSSFDVGASIAVDQSGNAYIAGLTLSADFPTASPLQTSGNIFVSKLDSSGSTLVYSTYFGSTGSGSNFNTNGEGIGGLAVDSSGNVYLTGAGTFGTFPVVNQISGACNANCQSGQSFTTFVSKINAAGSAIVYSSLVGGSIGNAVAVDSSGNAYVAGQIRSSADFPAVNAFQPTPGGASNDNAFLFKVNAAGSALVYSTFLGGSGFDDATGVAVDSSGDAYVAGNTNSPNFPILNQIANACISTCGNGQQANIFLSKFNPAGSALIYSSLIGGSDQSVAAPNPPFGSQGGSGSSLAIDSAGNAYVTGTTDAPSNVFQNSFPTTPGAFQTTNGNCANNNPNACQVPFAFKVNAAGTAFSYSTFLGVNGGLATGIAVDSTGNLGLVGIFSLLTVNPVSSQPGVSLAVLNPAGSALVFASSLSNGGTFSGGGPVTAAFDSTGSIYVTGNACSGLPVTSGAFQSTCRNIAGRPNIGGTAGNAFVSKISLSGTVSTPVASLSPSFLQLREQGVGTTSAPIAVTLTNTGAGALNITAISFAGTNAGDFGQSNTCGSAVAAGASCTIDVTFTPTSTGTRVASLTVASNASSTDSVTAIGTGSSVVFNPTSLTFQGTIGSSTTAQNVTLTNTASTPLNISSITATAPFSQTNTCGSSVAASANCTISVTFTPTGGGPASGTVSVTDNAPGSPQIVFLNGSAPNPVLLNPTGLSFSSQPVGTTSAPQTITLTNNESTTLNINGITATAPFSETNTCGSSLAASASCTISVTFAPTASGSAQGNLSIADSAPGSPQVVPLSGAGVAAPGVTPAPASLTFASQTVNTTSAAQSVTLTNSGSATLNITGVTITGVNAGDYSETNTCGATLAASANCTISVTFTPTAVGTRTAFISVTDNASGSPQTVALSGTATAATAPVVLLAPTTLTFASQTVNTTSAAQSITLTNSGNATLNLTGITITGTNAGDYSETNTCGATLAASANCAISVTFRPTATGTRTASVSIADNASGSPQTVALSGTAVAASAPAVTLAPTSVTFASQTVNTTSAAQSVTLTNSGNATLNLTGITITGTNAGDYSETNTCGATLAANANCAISVTFRPTATGTRTASVSITDNASGSPQTVALSGTAVAPDFSLSASPATISVTAGQSGTATIAVTPSNGFNQSVSFSCSGLPAGASCGFSPSTVTPSGTAASTTTLTISTSASSTLLPGGIRFVPARFPTGAGLASLLIFLIFFAATLASPARMRRRRVSAITGVLCLASIGLMTGCASGPNSTNTTVTITGTSGSGSTAITHTTVISLTVTK